MGKAGTTSSVSYKGKGKANIDARLGSSPATAAPKSSPTTSVPSPAPAISYDEAEANLNKGGLTGEALTMAQSALKSAYQTPPASPPSPEPAPPTETPDDNSDYVPRYYKPQTTITEPEDVETIQRRMQNDAQGEINSLRDFERTLIEEQKVLNDKDERSTMARNTLSGLAGSSEADIAQKDTSEKGRQANERIRTTVEVQVQGILSQIRKDAITEARNQRQDRVMDIEAQAAQQELTNKNLQNLIASGVTFDGLMKTSPKEFEYLARQFGSTDALRGAFVLNTPQDQILDKKLVGSTYVVSKQNPLTGKITVETVDIPGLPADYSATADLGDRIMFYDPTDPQGKQFFVAKGLTPSQRGSSSSVPGDTYGNDLDAIIGATLSTIPTKFGQSTFQGQIARARNDADKINLVAAQVLKGQPAEVKNDFRNQAVGISELDKAIALIDGGVESGALEAATQYTFNVFGRDYDPKLAQLESHIISAIQPYRNSVTGAAWGQQEDGEYQQLFGSGKYSPTELRQRLVTVKDMLKNKSAQGLNTFVNPMGYYENPFQSGLYGSRVLVSPTGEQFDASSLTPDEFQAALADGYTSQ